MGGGGWLEEKIHLDAPKFILPFFCYHLKRKSRSTSVFGSHYTYLPQPQIAGYQEFMVTPSVLLPCLRLPTVSTFSLPGEIALLEGLTVVYKSSIDLYFYVIGSSYENEVRIPSPLCCL